jgi:methyl-accepting chemotaxis protein
VNDTRLFWRTYLPLMLPAILLFLVVISIALFSTHVLSTSLIVIVITLAVAAVVVNYRFARSMAISLMQIQAGVERIAQIDNNERAQATSDNSVPRWRRWLMMSRDNFKNARSSLRSDGKNTT